MKQYKRWCFGLVASEESCGLPGAVLYITAVSTGTDRYCEKLLLSVQSSAESTSTPSSRASPRHACRESTLSVTSQTETLQL